MTPKVAALARIMVLVTTAFLIIIPASITYMWLLGSEELLLSEIPARWFVPPGILFEPGTLLFGVRLLCAGVTLLVTLPLLLALWHLRNLFALYQQGKFFMQEAAPKIRRFAGYMITYAFMKPIGGAGISFLSSMNNSPGNTWISISIADTNVAILFLGGTMFLLSYVLEEAHQISEENKSFI
ncbi:MAG: DUF2975 domain-containing protein [Pseudomonadales bacterium]|nr:DUF2975 domain-containing protein [Pseudomonadales bacterium]MBO6659075.1 DUF2975 domain-containing protein [Pseudomonadales bacterium]